MKIFLREILTERNMSMSELARISGVSVSHISDIVNGNKHPTIPAMCKFAVALEVPCSELFKCGDGVPEQGYQ